MNESVGTDSGQAGFGVNVAALSIGYVVVELQSAWYVTEDLYYDSSLEFLTAGSLDTQPDQCPRCRTECNAVMWVYAPSNARRFPGIYMSRN